MTKNRLDVELVKRKLVISRSQAENYIKLGFIKVDGKVVKKPHFQVSKDNQLNLSKKVNYVSRAGLKLESVANLFKINFKDKVVLDVGSSTGGFTDYALKNGAKKVIAVDVGTNQLHPSLHNNPKIELHEQTDIRDIDELPSKPDIVVIDVSFISIKEVLPHISKLIADDTQLIAMVKPQFESRDAMKKHKGVIKNESIRRQILKDFEAWVKKHFFIKNKKDSGVSGEKGNTERFYLLYKLRSSS